MAYLFANGIGRGPTAQQHRHAIGKRTDHGPNSRFGNWPRTRRHFGDKTDGVSAGGKGQPCLIRGLNAADLDSCSHSCTGQFSGLPRPGLQIRFRRGLPALQDDHAVLVHVG